MPSAKPYQVNDRAWAEVEAADNWYRERSPEAAVAFLVEVIEAFDTIARAPETWPEYLYGTRRYCFVISHLQLYISLILM